MQDTYIPYRNYIFGDMDEDLLQGTLIFHSLGVTSTSLTLRST